MDVSSKTQYALKVTKISDTQGQLLNSSSMRIWTYANEIVAYKQLQAGVDGGEAQKNGIPLVVSTGEQVAFHQVTEHGRQFHHHACHAASQIKPTAMSQLW
jgi:hypothetical protein